MGLTASSNSTPFNPRSMPKPSNQGYSTQILLLIIRMQISIFFTKVKEALFGAKRWCWQAKSSNFNGLRDGLIRKPDFMDPMNLFPSDAKITCTCQHDCIYKYVWWRFRRSYVKLIMLLDRRNWKKYIVVFRTLKRVVMTYHFFGRWPDLYGVTIPC